MAIINPPAWMQQGTYPARTDRLALGGLVANSGVVDSTTDFLATQTATPSMQVVVGKGQAYVFGTSITDQGVYHIFNDGPVTLTHAASNSTNPRIDLIVLRVYDADIAGTQNMAQLEIVQGTPASSPPVPTIPQNSIEIARVTVGANVSSIVNSNIIQDNVPVAASGLLSTRVQKVETPFLRCAQTATQSRAAGTWTQAFMSTVTHTRGIPLGTVSSQGTVTVTEAGLYLINSNVIMSGANFGARIFNATSNGTIAQNTIGAGALSSVNVTATVALSAGDQIITMVYPSATQNILPNSTANPCYMAFTKLS